MLTVRDLHAHYGKSHILQGVSLDVGANEVVSILGRNGVGRSTTLKAIMGKPQPKGSITFNGSEIAGRAPHAISRLGLGYVPEERAIFPTLTVEQNLILGMKSGETDARWSVDDTWAMFPQLKDRAHAPGGALSGGEQQMLTICRTLMGNPDLIMIDEPTEGLSPQMVERTGELIAEIARRGISILLVEQRLVLAMRLSSRVYVMGHGTMVFEGTPGELMENTAIRREWLEV
ncbi:ABC transporter ATP-binding protein [Rhizobium halophytocola]|uniref:Branched-chain amino acid transport system ATP-binding protein n=1 Tax=Rhizobium halophytocola TaxID=735519 RepID=A0ABS4DUQ0_9HYPH|nr:ABC transporter ATP-binding protein [Rhizobium halophytocola]MBP1849397.1 branched-chain amino acid transport system ATP-binding protein [Rhizobium halophytocola]